MRLSKTTFFVRVLVRGEKKKLARWDVVFLVARTTTASLFWKSTPIVKRGWCKEASWSANFCLIRSVHLNTTNFLFSWVGLGTFDSEISMSVLWFRVWNSLKFPMSTSRKWKICPYVSNFSYFQRFLKDKMQMSCKQAEILWVIYGLKQKTKEKHTQTE